MPEAPFSCIPPRGQSVTPDQVAAVVAQACPRADFRGKRIVAIVPDGTRTAPIGLLFKALYAEIGEATAQIRHHGRPWHSSADVRVRDL